MNPPPGNWQACGQANVSSRFSAARPSTSSAAKPDQVLRIADRRRAIAALLGEGTDGQVWRTDVKTAVKAFERQSNFDNELACYQLLLERGIEEINGYSIPRLIAQVLFGFMETKVRRSQRLSELDALRQKDPAGLIFMYRRATGLDLPPRCRMASR